MDDIVFVEDETPKVKKRKRPARSVEGDFDFSSGQLNKGRDNKKPKTASQKNTTKGQKGLKKPRAKRRKRLAEDKSLKDDEPPLKDPAIQIVTERYRVFFPQGRIDNCEVVGTDIGTSNLAFTAIGPHPDNENWPCVYAVGLIDVSAESAHAACDNIDELLINNEDFEWIKNSEHHGIEQQTQVNAKARIVAGSIRSTVRGWKFAHQEQPDVSYVPAPGKYDLVQLFVDDEEWYGVDPQELKGANNTKKRKLLGELHARGIWKYTNNHAMSKWFRNADIWTSQKHDMSDSFLIAVRKWLELRGKAPKTKRGPKIAGTSAKKSEKIKKGGGIKKQSFKRKMVLKQKLAKNKN